MAISPAQSPFLYHYIFSTKGNVFVKELLIKLAILISKHIAIFVQL